MNVVWFLAALASLSAGQTDVRGTAAALPLVIMMDSSHPARVYDQETLDAKRTNADVLSDLLSDLPIRRLTETIAPDWRRDEEILRLRPELIVIHYSGFNREDSSGPRTRLKLLVQVLAETNTRFLIYSRAKEDDLRSNLSQLLGDLYEKYPGLQQRIRPFGLLNYGPPRWRDAGTSTQLKRVVKETLRLP